MPAYTNPLINNDFPDPSVIEVRGKGYFAYATHDEFSPTINNILVSHSWDLVNWSAPKGALLSPPLWAQSCHRFWCPQVVQMGSLFHLYYAAEPDTKNGMCIALATSANAIDFTDIGKPLNRLEGSTYQMIDPCFFIDPLSGKYLLYYGSAHEPIRVEELAKDGCTIISEPAEVLYPGKEKYHILREGAFITYNKKWQRYFMYVSGDNTWAENGYAVSVYWSADPMAIFTAIPGDNIILKGNAYWDSPGQNCVITDAEGNEWMVYHAVDTADRFIKDTDKFKRKMCMDKILYSDEGWPYIKNGSPSFETQTAPAVVVEGLE